MTALPRESAALDPPPLRMTACTVHPAVRYAELVPEDRTLLLALETQGGVSDEATLAQVMARGRTWVHERLCALAALGLVQGNAGCWQVDPALRSRIQRDLDVSVGARVVVRSENTVRCHAPHEGERVLRAICREMFAPHVVRLRVPLRQVLDVQVMNSLLDEPDRAFLANGNVHLDVVVEDGETEAPLLALELDGPQHERSPQLERDTRKDRILRVAGLPLLRLWTCEAQPPGQELQRTLLGWRLRQALQAPGFRQACSPALLGALKGATETSGVPGFEVEPEELRALLGGELLTTLLGARAACSPEGLARQTTLGQIVTSLRMIHNDEGVRQWFERPRYMLRGNSPRDILQGDWAPEDPRVRLVCRLAAAGGSFFAT